MVASDDAVTTWTCAKLLFPAKLLPSKGLLQSAEGLMPIPEGLLSATEGLLPAATGL